MNRFAHTVLLLVASSAIAKGGIADETAQRINHDVRTVLVRTETPSATILVIRDGRPIYRHAFGLRDLEDKLPGAMDIHYEIGSITKQFTAAAILQLQDAGKLNIDAKVSTYLPDAPHAGEVTLRQLLTHTSGIPDYFDLISDEQATKPVTFQGLMSLVADKPLEFPPGSRARYSNTGYMILGRIIEVTSHESYRQYIRAHMIVPAGMTHSFTVPDESSIATMATGYRHVDGKLIRGLTIHDSFSWSAGDIVSTVDDLEKWNEALVGGKIVPKADYELMSTPQMSTGGEDTGYGLGLFIDKLNGQARIGHTGGSFGFTAANFYFPAQKLRIIAFTNNADQPPEAGETITNAIFADLYPDIARAASVAAPGEDRTVTAKAQVAFEHLQQGIPDASVFSASFNEKMQAGLATRMAGRFRLYGASTAFVFKGRRLDDEKTWSDYRIEFGPGSTLKLSFAQDGDGKVTSLEIDGF